MSIRTGSFVLLAAVFALATSLTGVAQVPCGVTNQITCLAWDGSSSLDASQNDTNPNGYGNFATVYQQFTLPKGPTYWDVESFHWVGGYFNPPNQGPITTWTLTLYNDDAGTPGAPIAVGSFAGNGGETFIGNVDGFPFYVYGLYFLSFDMSPGTYWASVVPDFGFPPQWGWTTAGAGTGGYQCYFGSCGLTGSDYAFAVDGRPIPEPGTFLMLGTGILGLASTLRRKLF